MPPSTRAELVDGVVYMPSPMRGDHGLISREISGWLFHYQRFTPGIWGAAAATTILGQYGEPQPDGVLLIPEELGGQTRIVVGYITGPPELIVEVARSSRAFDLGKKKGDYERAGVREYVVVGLDPDRVHWFIHCARRFEDFPPGPDGIFRSEIFPGLWLDPEALYSGDLDRLVEVLEQGLATPEHAAFAAHLAAGEGGA
jgi:Uma2 family endonuclease